MAVIVAQRIVIVIVIVIVAQRIVIVKKQNKKTMTTSQYLQLCKTEFSSIYGWAKNWCSHQKDIKHSATNQRFFDGNSSYMDLGELLRKNENEASSPCVIFDTDVHLQLNIDNDTSSRTNTLYFCVLSEDMHEGGDIKVAKDLAEHLATVFVAFYRDCRHVGNKTVKRANVTRIGINSTTPFLNGWQAVAVSITTTDKIPCGMANEYE